MICDACNVREPWEHRCHGEHCTCPECREADRLFGVPTRVTPPGECANPECDHDRSIPSPGCALRRVTPPGE